MGKKELTRRQNLIDQFVASFKKLDEMTAFDHDPIAIELASAEMNEFGFREWRAKEVNTNPAALDALYAKLPARFPPIYEQLVLSYRWAEVDLRLFRLLPNPPGSDLKGLQEEIITRDPAIWDCLSKSGYMQFGKGPDMDYDPVCFDLSSRTKNGDYRVVKVDHEEILCNDRLKVVAQLAASFEDLVLETIGLAAKK